MKEGHLPNTEDYFHLDSRGFPLSRGSAYDEWLEVRRRSVSATDATKLLKKSGAPSSQREKLVESKLGLRTDFHFSAYDLGIEREPVIAELVRELYPEEFFETNDFLYHANNPRHVATPDLVSFDSVCEIKVSTQPLSRIRGRYMDQLQWQMYVLDRPLALFVVENRYDEELEFEWVHADPKRIQDLVVAADCLLADIDQREVHIRTQPEVPREVPASEPLVVEEIQPRVSIAAPSYQIRTDSPDVFEIETMRRALTLYCEGYDSDSIAEKIGFESRDVVANLGRSIFTLGADLIDPNAPNFMNYWSEEEH
ncbi:MAG: hypothetical protein RIR34_991, partial [Actinomycetota bacterium]